MTQIIQDLQSDSVRAIYKKHGLIYVGLFGSNARGDTNALSDIDLLLDFNETKSLFDLARVKIDLEKTVGKRIDLALRGSLKKSLEPYILKDLVTIYDQN